MSRKKYTKSENNLDKSIIKRTMKVFNVSKKYQLAEILDISPQDLSNRTGKGTILKLIEMESLKRKVNYDWILTGEGEPYPKAHSNNTGIPTINETQKDYDTDRFGRAVSNLKNIFDSGNDVLITAIEANLSAFKAAALADKEKREMKAGMEEMDKKIKRLEVENKELKGCAGGSPPLTLTPVKCDPTGTEDPET
jgi:hypothetical protein